MRSTCRSLRQVALARRHISRRYSARRARTRRWSPGSCTTGSPQCRRSRLRWRRPEYRRGMPVSDSLLLDAVAEVAQLAGDTALRYFRTDVAVESKRDGTPVTVADRTAEQVAREWLRVRFPKDGILGEELGEERRGARRRWVLDPIDGTKTFVRGVPLWGPLVAP